MGDHFDLSTSDVDWLRDVGRRGWVVLTKDRRIRRREAEFRAVCEAGVAMFVLTGASMTGVAMATAFQRAYPRIQKLLRDYALPFIASVSANGDVRLLTEATRHADRRKG